MSPAATAPAIFVGGNFEAGSALRGDGIATHYAIRNRQSSDKISVG
jgi:hypothetical protein